MICPSSRRTSVEVTKHKNIMMDEFHSITIHIAINDVASCVLKEEIYDDSSIYADKVIRRSEIIDLGNYEDEDELVVKDPYSWQIKTIKCGISQMYLGILMIRYHIPRSIILYSA